LIKIFDKEENADAFIKSGDLFSRTLGDFKRIEDDGARGDVYEGVTGWHQPDRISLSIAFEDKDGLERTLPIEKLAGPFVIQNTGYDRLNVYCMYAVKIPEFEEPCETEEERLRAVEKINRMLKEKSTLSDKALSLGEFAVVVYRVGDFLDRVNKASDDRNFTCWNGAIGYYDPQTFHGTFEELEAIFRKRNTYEHQNEYRFAFGSHEPEGAKTIRVGSLEDIAFKIQTCEINEKLQLRLAD
jgi:hypothetical protein